MREVKKLSRRIYYPLHLFFVASGYRFSLRGVFLTLKGIKEGQQLRFSTYFIECIILIQLEVILILCQLETILTEEMLSLVSRSYCLFFF